MPTKPRAYRRGFTLIEVNLAVFLMATGVLAICALYSLGFRENRQSVEDVVGAAWAEAYLSPLVQGLSATNMPWSKWREIGKAPPNSAVEGIVADGLLPCGSSEKECGWYSYLESGDSRSSIDYRVKPNPRSSADRVWNAVNAGVKSPYRCPSPPSIPKDFEYALVATRRGTIIQLSFRSSRRRDTLMTQPTYVTEVRFNGDPDN